MQTFLRTLTRLVTYIPGTGREAQVEAGCCARGNRNRNSAEPESLARSPRMFSQ